MLFLQAKQENHIIYKLQIIIKILNLAFIILLIKFNSNILIVKFLSSLIFILKPICQYIYVRKKHKICLDKNEKMEKIPQKKDGMAQHIAYIVHNNTDVVVLSLFTNISTVSIYSIYLLVVNSIKSVIECLTSSIEATFGEMIAKKENLKLNEFFSKFECCYYICINILFSCAYVLIIPFIKLYTKKQSLILLKEVIKLYSKVYGCVYVIIICYYK
jgi:O-antigen/teichoic acid export membrane protein